MKIRFFALVLGVFTLASCEFWEPPVDEPVVVDGPADILLPPLPPPPVMPDPEPIFIPDPDPVVIVEPEPIVAEAVVVFDGELADEIITGDLAFDQAVEEEASSKETVVVYYGTNRELLADSTGQPIQTKFPEDIYGDLPGPLHYGRALIVIPPRHKKGRLEGALGGRSTNDKRYVVLKDLVHTNYDSVMSRVQGELAKAKPGEKTIVAYVHGFNTSFEKAARRAGQLKYDLDFAGPLFFFSWPSKTSALGYVHATNLAEISYTQMTEFLHDLTKQEADRIIIIAHSMGTRILSHGLIDLANQDMEAAKKITKVILAAPDIDARVFKERLLPRFNFLTNPITLYASSKDKALQLSNTVNGLPRIGDVSKGLAALDNVVMIDATDVKSNMFNHTYFGDSVSIVDDFKGIISGPVAAKDRKKTLVRMKPDPFQVWKALKTPRR